MTTLDPFYVPFMKYGLEVPYVFALELRMHTT